MIVNPWIFYFAEICEGLKTFAIIVVIIALIYVLCMYLLYHCGETKTFWWNKK